MKFMQTDSRWGGLGYPKKPYYIRNCGCGEVSIANIIIETDKYANATPKTIQPYCVQYADPRGNGTYWAGIPKMLEHYGLTEVKEHQTMKPLWTELAKGKRVAVFLMGSRLAGSKKVKWTGSAHFVCSTNYKYKDGKHYVYVKDSYSNSSNRNGWITYEGNMKNAVLKVWSAKLPVEKAYTPTKPYTGGLPINVVKRGSKGIDVKHVQKFLNWCINAKLDMDGKCGSKTVSAIKKFQKQNGLKVDGKFGSASKKKAEAIIKKYAPTPSPTPKPPTTATKIINRAKDLSGKASTPTQAYKDALNKAYPNRKSWGTGARLGRSCDVFVGTVLRSLGLDKDCPRGLRDQLTHKPNSKYFTRLVYNNVKPYNVSKTGDIVIYDKPNGHACIRATNGIYEANHSSKKYPHFMKGFSRLNRKRNKVVIWRPKG